MNWIDVISAGPGGAELLTAQAKAAIENAEAVFCAQRNADLVSPDKRRPLTPFEDAMAAMEGLNHPAVLVSGDAGLYSMLGLLTRHFGWECLRVIPGVSSLQAFCARLSIPWQNAKILSAHGRDCAPEALCYYARTSPAVLLLLDGEHDPRWVQGTLRVAGLDHLPITVGERISLPDEQIAPYEDRDYDPLSVLLITNPHPASGLPPVGLSDDAFIRGKTPMTKREIRIQVLAALQLPPDAVVWDVGAGTGSVSVECARQCPLGAVYAVERDGDALALIEQNKQQFHLQNLHVIPGEAPEVLADLPAPTHVFLGGTGKRTKDIYAALPAGVRVVATAVTLESAQEFAALLPDYEAAQIAVSRLEKVGSYRMFRASNPVFVFSAVKGENP